MGPQLNESEDQHFSNERAGQTLLTAQSSKKSRHSASLGDGLVGGTFRTYAVKLGDLRSLRLSLLTQS